MNLHNESAVNVAALLKEFVGSTRQYALTLDSFPLDDDLLAANVRGQVRLTRLPAEIVARLRVSGEVTLECQRCLQAYEETFTTTFDEEFREAVDVRTGAGISSDREVDERFSINENHELDFAEPLRQEILVSLPMRPTCGDQCPGPAVLESGDDSDIDDRFAALARLLDEETPSAENRS